MVCTVAGESGVGKTTLARDCALALDERGLPARILHQDDYFFLPPRANHRRRLEDSSRVGPDEVNVERLIADLLAFRQGADALVVPRVDASADDFVEVTLDLRDTRVLIVEGTYVTALPDVDLRVFVRGSHDSTLAARRSRGRDPIEVVTVEILAREHDLIAPHAGQADLVLDQLSPG